MNKNNLLHKPQVFLRNTYFTELMAFVSVAFEMVIKGMVVAQKESTISLLFSCPGSQLRKKPNSWNPVVTKPMTKIAETSHL